MLTHIVDTYYPMLIRMLIHLIQPIVKRLEFDIHIGGGHGGEAGGAARGQ